MVSFEPNQDLRYCRAEVSRILGLIGAPPLGWEYSTTPDASADVVGHHGRNLVTPAAASLVVEFLEAHLRFFMAVDESYRWLQVSASLHLGLGPRSQCVERVERAAMAREFRARTASNATDGKTTQKSLREPQRGISSSILSLSLVRQNLAKIMVDQSDSLLHVWSCLESSTDSLDPPQAIGLELPTVIDLTWIKGSRQQLAELLSRFMDESCTAVDGLVALSSDRWLQSQMTTSLCTAQNSREYILGHLLLGKEKTDSPTTSSLPNSNDPLLLSLIQYREHLDALSGAIWSCQQYTDSRQAVSQAERAGWWDQIQQLSSTCRSIETEIGARYFAKSSEDNGEADLVEELGVEDSVAPLLQHQSGDYEHGEDGRESAPEKEIDLPSRTLVFKGHGVKDERTSKGCSRRRENNTHDVGHNALASLPPRDSVSEQLMVKELQKRITLLRPPEEEEEELESEAEKTARAGRAPTMPLFLGASGSLLSELKLSLPAANAQEEEQVVG